MVKLIKSIQEEALLHAERLAESVAKDLHVINTEMALGAAKAASSICLEIYNLGAAWDLDYPTREGGSTT